MQPFTCEDAQKQFEEKVLLIANDELKKLEKEKFKQKIQQYTLERKQYYKNNQEILLKFLGRNQRVDDYDYQMSVDTELSLLNQEQTV